MREHFHLGFLEGIWIPLLVISFASGCSKTDQTTSRDVQPVPLLAAATIPPTNNAPSPAPAATLVATPNRPTAAERLVEIDRLLARPLTGTPESADERTLLRAERAALIRSGQVPSQPVDPVSAQPVQSNSLPIGENATVDAPSSQIVIASSSSSLPFLEQMTPSERDHYFEELWLQNGSFVNVNHSGFGVSGFAVNRGRPNMRHPARGAKANQPGRRSR